MSPGQKYDPCAKLGTLESPDSSAPICWSLLISTVVPQHLMGHMTLLILQSQKNKSSIPAHQVMLSHPLYCPKL